MYNGILPVYKERGLTSHDVVFKLRKILKTKKIGHTGTLDPEVSGVLPVCIGIATKVSDYVMDMGKTYEATITLGRSTTTEDQTGETVDKVEIEPQQVTESEIDRVLELFIGETEQIPPMYSSVKVNGKKLYEYARNNETVERPKRTITIKELVRTSDLRFNNQECHFDIRVTCGKGTYIRTLATDIGGKLGFPAHMSKLTRVESGGFKLENSLTLEQIKELHERESLQSHLFSIEYGLKGLPSIEISDENLKRKILNGQKLDLKNIEKPIKNQVVFIDQHSQQVLAIYMVHPSNDTQIKPKKVFN